MARQKRGHKFNEDVENYLTKMIYEDEYKSSASAKSLETLDFESTLAMLECKREEREYDWMSNLCDPHLASIILTDASSWANQYFQSRDFVEVRLEGNTPEDQAKCIAAKKCVNHTLNNREIYHFHKYIRARTINSLGGQVYALENWEQETIPVVQGYRQGESTFDEITGEEIPGPSVPVYGEKVIRDQYNYDVYDSRNVFVDRKYTYSIQDKTYIIFRDEVTYEQLKADESKKGYFNLHLLKEEVKPQEETDTEKETVNKNEPGSSPKKTVSKTYDRLLRLGKVWAVVKEKTDDDYPKTIVPGYNKDGEVQQGAELIEAVIEEVYSGNTKVLIRFQPQPYRDPRGRAYRPVLRGWCYIHPTKDQGLSDGKYNREIQIWLNDCLNMAGDRVKLSTIPALRVAESTWSDESKQSSIYFAPENVMVEQNQGDIQEFRIDGNVDGILGMYNIAKKEGQVVSASFPTTQGELPDKPSTTATAIAGAEQRTNIRSNYKSLTFEYTYLLDQNTHILWMTNQFATEETMMKMMGDSLFDFDADATYSYTPVSSNIEVEYSKYRKIQNYDQNVGRLSGLVQFLPEIIPVIAFCERRILELQGDEYQIIAKMIEDLSKSKPILDAKQTGQVKDQVFPQSSNQSGFPVSTVEQTARDMGMLAGMTRGPTS